MTREHGADPATIVQARLDAHNAHDVDALLALYADDARQFRHPDTPLASGAAQIGARFAARFGAIGPHATLPRRAVIGATVIEHESVAGEFPEGPGKVDMPAIHEVGDGRIAQAWFLARPWTADAARR